ncbi:hypothetical protein AAC387_Pa11g2053 [Persea americana]
MGKTNYDPVMQHFSHEHPLELSNTQQTITTASCFGCKLKISGWFYACKPCNYHLHVTCSQMPQLINHPSDPNHPLFLIPVPAYPEGFFCCDACGRRGEGFSYHCQVCELDVHTICASMPLSITHQAHQHTLQLVFSPPYQGNGFSCDICGKLGSNHWLYRCSTCEFDAHLGCATSKPKPQVAGLQQHHMVPVMGPQVHGLGAGSGSWTLQSHAPNYSVNSSSVGVSQAIGPGGRNDGLMNQAADVFIDSAGQNLVQSIVGGGDGGGNGDGGSSSSSNSNSNGVLDVGSSVLNAVFGGSSSTDN